MRRLTALAVGPFIGLLIAVPAPAQAFQATTHHKPGHDHGPGREGPSDGGAADDRPVLEASGRRVAPRTAVHLTVTAGTAITGGTWKVRNGDGQWRELSSWTDPDAKGRSATHDVTSPRDGRIRYFKVVVRFDGGSAASNRVRVRSVREREESPELAGPANSDGFKAVTWNVYYGTPVSRLRPILDRLVKDGVSVFLMQEMSNPDARRMLEDQGLAYHYVGYQWVVAWNPEVWTASDLSAPRLSSTSFTRLDGSGPIYVDSALGTLRDGAGRTLDVMSYHLPPNVQVRNPERNRLRIDRQAAATWRRLVDATTSDAVLFGGDDNVDESSGYRSEGAFWDFLRRPATGLRLVQAPSGTIGRHRRIDDFRVRGLRPGAGYTGDGGGDHQFFVSRFTWR